MSSSGVDTLEVVAQAGVALEQQRPEHREVAARQCVGGREHPRVLADDVTCARLVAHLLGVASRRRGDPERRPRPPRTRRGGTRTRDPASVRGTPAVHDEDRDAGRERDRVDRERRGSRSGARARPARRASKLVHQPAGHAGGHGLGVDASRAARPSQRSRSPGRQRQGQRDRQAPSSTTGRSRPARWTSTRSGRPRPGRRAPAPPRRRSGPTRARPGPGSVAPATGTSTRRPVARRGEHHVRPRPGTP